MYLLSCERTDTALDIARKFSAWALHQDDERPYLVNALYAVIRKYPCSTRWLVAHHSEASDDPSHVVNTIGRWEYGTSNILLLQQ